MGEKDYFETMDLLHDNYSSSARSIPIEWIKEYGVYHDAVCQVNLNNMIHCYETNGDYKKM
jgi:hypothetical protein